MQVAANASGLDGNRNRSGFKITRVETIPLHVPFKKMYVSAAGPRPYVEVLVVRLHTDEGLVGIGETQAWRRLGSAETLPKLTDAIHAHLAPRVIGRSAFDLSSIMHSLDEALDHSLYAKAAIGDALYDLQGKALGVPVYQLLGGKCRDAIPACAVLAMKNDVRGTLENAQGWYDRGFRTFTIKVGTDAKVDYANVRALSERFGADVSMRVDANAVMGFDDALRLLTKLEPFSLDGAEQPLAPWNIDGLAELARRITIPIIADESLSDEHALIDIIRRRAATGVQTKEAKHGGIWHIQKLWTIASAAGMRIYPGNHPSVSVATAAVAQLAAAWPGALCEGPFAYGVSGDLPEDIVTEPLAPRGNLVPVPQGPGLGVTLDDGKIAHLRIDR
jgi:L-alanine-DL-glutamate epimerase-like enolase superfamily enzyme